METLLPHQQRALDLLAATAPAPGLSHQAFAAMLPAPYVERTDPDDLCRHYRVVASLQADPRGDRSYHSRGDIEEFQIHRFDLRLLRRALETLPSRLAGDSSLVRVSSCADASSESVEGSAARGFMITAWYQDPLSTVRASEFTPPAWTELSPLFLDDAGRVVRHASVRVEQAAGSAVLHASFINASPQTVWRNLLETLDSAGVFPSCLEVWRVHPHAPNVHSLHRIEAHFGASLDEQATASVQQDLERYVQVRLAPRSVFDLIGPTMVGPSSSHTAGANRIGRLARHVLLALLENRTIQSVERVHVNLLGSFRDTGVGHRTPAALGGGLCGLASDDPDMLQRGDRDRMRDDPPRFGDARPSFGGYRRGSAQDDARYEGEGNANIAEVVASTDAGELRITGFSIGGGNVEIRFLHGRRLAAPITGATHLWLRGWDIAAIGGPRPDTACGRVDALDPSGGSAVGEPVVPFNTFEELVLYAARTSKSLVEVVLDHERNLAGTTAEEVRERMGRAWSVMRAAVESGLTDDSRSTFGLSGGDGKRVAAWIDANPHFDGIHGLALSYATSAAEVNARSGLVVACPTAGSCGILPSVLRAWQRLAYADDGELVDALLVAGLMGMVLFDDVSTAGADFGCQAEIGAAAAMAAAALAHLQDGSPECVVHAFVLALKNSMGLVCDPVAGLVEVPCVKRNGVYSSLAISSAAMACAGVRSFISPDEVVLAVREVGARLHRDYKETAGGGLARTRDGKRVERRFRSEVLRWFDGDSDSDAGAGPSGQSSLS